MQGVKQPHLLGYTMHKVIEEYLAVHSPIAPVVEGRCTATDVPHELLTQVMGLSYEFS